jgi:hypothetical protein
MLDMPIYLGKCFCMIRNGAATSRIHCKINPVKEENWWPRDRILA